MSMHHATTWLAGTPTLLDDLGAPACVPFWMPGTGRPMPWLFRRDGAEVELPLDGRAY